MRYIRLSAYLLSSLFFIPICNAEILGFRLIRNNSTELQCNSYKEIGEYITCEKSGNELKVRKDSVIKIEPIQATFKMNLPQDTASEKRGLVFSQNDFDAFKARCPSPYRKGWSNTVKYFIEQARDTANSKLRTLESQANSAQVEHETSVYKSIHECYARALEKGYYREQMRIWDVKD
jgi:hypothetical protein